MKIFISRNGQQFGPYSVEEAQQLIQRGQLSPDDLACAERGTQWVPLASLLPPPAASVQPANSSGDGSTKKVVTILAICLGLFLFLACGSVAIYYFVWKKPKVDASPMATTPSIPNPNVSGKITNEETRARQRLLWVQQRHLWIELINSIQSTLDGADGKILILTNPNELMPKGTNEVNQMNAEKIAEADTAVWLQSLTMTKPEDNLGGQQGGFGGAGGETISVIYLKLMAKNVLADAPNGRKVRTRETLNREFATMMAKQFRRNELFSDDEALTKVDGQILMKEIDGMRWFEFVIQLSLKDPIVMKDKVTEFGKLGPYLHQLMPKDTVATMAGNDFTTHIVNVVQQLNKAAKDERVGLPRDPPSKSDVQFPYYFTFFEVITKEHGVTEDKVAELQVQLEDVGAIIKILLRSRVQSIELMQRNPVTKEDVAATRPNDYIKERQKYTNSVAVVRPYRIKFRCLSGGIAKSLSGFASEDLFYVVRKFEVRQAGANSAASGGMGGFGGAPDGGEEVGGAGVPLAPLEQRILEEGARLATPKSKNIMREQLLEVTVNLDVIRRKSQSSDPLGDLKEPLASEWNLLRAIASDPPAIKLDGTNHLVFNAAKWNRVITTSVSGPTVTNVFRDSPDLPLGISALRVTEIREVRLLITPKIQFNRSPAKLGENNMRYRFEAIDEYPSVFASLPEYMAYWRRDPNWKGYAQYNTPRMQSFMPQKRPFPANTKALSPNLQPHPLRKLSTLHLFNDAPGVLQQHPDWFVGFRFTKATKADQIEDVICTLDIIHGLPGGGMITNRNRVAKHNQPISFTRGYEADLFFQTKFTAQPMQWKNCRVGRRFSIDGEVFRILKVTPDLVQLVSDQEFGGNRKIYDKPFRPGPIQVRPGLNIPVPGGGTNAVPARPPGVTPPAVGGLPPPKK